MPSSHKVSWTSFIEKICNRNRCLASSYKVSYTNFIEKINKGNRDLALIKVLGQVS